MNESTGNREIILEHALALFSERGYEAVSVQELVNAAGVTKPTLYYYFGSKTGVYEAILERHYARLDSALAAAARYEPHPADYFADMYPVLLGLTLCYFDFARADEAFYRMALASLFLPPSSQVQAMTRKYHFRQYGISEAMFASMSAAHGNLRGKERRLSWTYIGLVNAFIGLYFGAGDSPALNGETAGELVRQFMHGIHA